MAASLTDTTGFLGAGTTATYDINDDVDIASTLWQFDSSGTDTTNDGDYVGVSFPMGWQTTGSSIVIGTNAAPSKTTILSVSDSDHAGSFIMGTADTDFAIGHTTGTALKISSLGTPDRETSNTFTQSAFDIYLWIADVIGDDCLAVKKITNLSLVAGEITGLSGTPETSKIAGPDTVRTTLSIQFTISNPIPAGGSIEINIDDNWDVDMAASACTASGLTALSSIVGCSRSGDVLTVNGFAATAEGTQITVTLGYVLPPTTANTYDYVDSIVTMASDDNYIDRLVDTTDDQCTVADSGTEGTSVGLTAMAYPNAANLDGVDIYLEFSLSLPVPAEGTLTITSFTGSWAFESADITDNCWTNIKYTTCVYSSSKVVITLSEDLETTTKVQVFLDTAFDLPATGGTSTNGWVVTSQWNGVTITTDTSTTWTFTTNDEITKDIGVVDIELWATNAGATSDWTFTLTSEEDVEAGDLLWIQFPSGFDAYLGSASNDRTDCEEDTYYIPCESEALGDITCMVDDWYLIVSGITNSIDADATDNEIDILVRDIVNPEEGSDYRLRFYHLDSAGALKAFLVEDTSLTAGNIIEITDIATATLILKSVEIDSSKLGETANYMFDFYAIGTYDEDFEWTITVPQQYHLKLQGTTSPSCTSVYFDQSGLLDAELDEELDWNTISSCSAARSKITLAVPSQTADDHSFISTDLIRWSLSMPNPQWGFERSSTSAAANGYWDLVDEDTFGEYDIWSNRFEIEITDTINHEITHKSYGVLNSAYLGFTEMYTETGINEYSPQSGNDRIVILAGTQSSDITISTTGSSNWHMMSQSVVFTPTTNSNYPDSGNLEYTSWFNEWTAWQMVDSIKFRVSAKTGTSPGLYYIDWATEEVTQAGISVNRYNAPVSILVEVGCNSDGDSTASITVGTIPSIYKGYTSIPISVTLEHAPATDLTLSFSFGALSGISTNPTSLTFGPDEDIAYFEIVVASTYEST